MKTPRNFLLTLPLFTLTGTRLLSQTFVWEDKANGQRVADCNGAESGGEFFWPNNNNWGQDALIGNNPCPPHGAGFLREPSNWNLPSYPNDPAAMVQINTNPAVQFNVDADIGTLLVSAGSTLRILGSNTLSVHGGNITNNGIIDIDDLTSSSADINITANTLLTGIGKTRFVSDDDNLIIAPSAAQILTIDDNHELIATANSGAGASQSRVMASFVNNGIITADVGGLRIDTHPKTNNNMIRAINGGLIRLIDTSVDNSSGIITADPTSTVEFNNVTISGGTLGGSGRLDITSGDARFTNNVTLNSASTLYIDGSDDLTLTDTFTNNGRVQLNDLSSSVAQIVIDGNVTLAGNGSIFFASNDDNIVTALDLENDILTIARDQKLVTSDLAIGGDSASRIIAGAVNNGLISADQGGLQLDTEDKTNKHRIEAVNGGKLQISGITIENENGTITSGEASEVNLNDATLDGGILNGSGPVQITGRDATFRNGLSIAPESLVVIDSGDKLMLEGTLDHNGTIELRDLSSSVAELEIVGNVDLRGTGTILFNTNDDNWIVARTPEDVLNIGEGIELLAGSNAIAGDSQSKILARFLNQGTVTADGGGLQFEGTPKANQNLIQTLNGGTIRLRSNTLDNTDGIVCLDSGGTLRLFKSTLTGGSVNGMGNILVETGDEHLLGPIEIGPDITATTGTGRILHLSGEITNNGTLVINDTSSGYAILRIESNTTLNGRGKALFASNDDNYFDSTDPAHLLTNGVNHTMTTVPATLRGESRLRAKLLNLGTIEAREGDLTLDDQPKTNNGIFRAALGGILEVRTADTILTNYNAASQTLTGGRWEAVDGTIDLQGATINRIGPGTEILLSGPDAGIPQLPGATVLDGTLRIREGAILATEGNLEVNGVLEFGLGDGSVNGFDTTGLSVSGDLDLTNCIIDVANLGLTPGGYEVLTWSDTSIVTGRPTLRNVPPGTSYNLNPATGTLTLVINQEPEFEAPVIISIAHDPAANTTTITYNSVDGEVFEVRGGTNLENFSNLPDTEIGNGSVMEYHHSPTGEPDRYFYQFIRTGN